jgi:hypothetical protein
VRTSAGGDQVEDAGRPAAYVVPWACRLRDERVRRLWSQKVMAARLREAADEHTRTRLPTVENIARRVRGYEAGEHRPGELYVELYCRAFGLTRAALFGPHGEASGAALPVTEHDAEGLATWITVSNTSDDAIRHIDQRRAELAEAHTRLPPGQVLADVLDLHRQVRALLQGGRQRCGQTRELFRIETGLLAHASLLLDDIDHAATAQVHGKVAVLCAEEAGCSPDAPVRVLLASQEASAAALLGDGDRARRALRDAEDAASRIPAIPAVSTWACPGPRRALYAMSVAIRLGDPDAALMAAADADAGWAAGEPWLYGVWSLVRVGAAIAHVMRGDVDAAAAQLGGVLALAPAFRITTISNYLADLDARLAQRRFRTVPVAQELRGQIAAFTAAADPGVATKGTYAR